MVDLKDQIKLIIFDFDGVIADTWEHSYKLNVLDWPGLKPEEHKNFFNGNIYEALAKMPPSVRDPEEKAKWLEDVYHPQKQELPMFDGIDSVIKDLAGRYVLVINTSARADKTRQYLIRNGLGDNFKEVYGLELSQSKEEKFRKILEDFNLKSGEAVQITDTVGDMLEAAKVGIRSVMVTYGYQNREHFSHHQQDVIGFADSPADILQFVK